MTAGQDIDLSVHQKQDTIGSHFTVFYFFNKIFYAVSVDVAQLGWVLC